MRQKKGKPSRSKLRQRPTGVSHRARFTSSQFYCSPSHPPSSCFSCQLRSLKIQRVRASSPLLLLPESESLPVARASSSSGCPRTGRITGLHPTREMLRAQWSQRNRGGVVQEGVVRRSALLECVVGPVSDRSRRVGTRWTPLPSRSARVRSELSHE